MADISSIKDVIKSWIEVVRKLKLTPSLCRPTRNSHRSNQAGAYKIWSELPSDILDEVISNLDLSKDYLHSIAVCKRWRSIGCDLKSNPKSNLQIFHPLPRKYHFPMLLQPTGKSSDLHYFYSIVEKKVRKLNVPEIRNKWIAGSWRGWLVTLDMEDLNSIHLLNPITKVKILLPPLSAYSGVHDPDFDTRINKSQDVEKIIVVSFEENIKQSNCTIFALEKSRRSLHICKIGDNKWKRIIIPKVDNFGDVINFKGIIYFVAYFGTLFAIETNPIIKVIPIITEYRNISYAQRYYLVESLGDLLMITRHFCSMPLQGSYKTIFFKVYKLQEEQGHKIWKEIESLHDQVLFVGRSETICLDSNLYPKCQKNCIYFADDGHMFYYRRAFGSLGRSHDNGVYHMNDKKIEHFLEHISYRHSLPVMWFSPNPW